MPNRYYDQHSPLVPSSKEGTTNTVQLVSFSTNFRKANTQRMHMHLVTLIKSMFKMYLSLYRRKSMDL